MSIQDICFCGGGGIIALLTIIQVTPIKVNPWSALMRWIGRAMNVEIKEDIQKVKDEIYDELLEVNANTARYRIVRFADEIRHNPKPHSEEHYNQILGDIKSYEDFCASHEGYENGKAKMAISIIRGRYEEHWQKKDFL